jgi:hypothetical protein
MPKKHLSKRHILLWITAFILSAVIFAGLLVLGTPNPNDTYPKDLTVRDYRYELELKPSHPKQGNKIHYSIAIKDHKTKEAAANVAFIVMVSKAPDRQGRLVQIGSPKEVSRAEIVSDSAGTIQPSYAIEEAGDYHIDIVPAALWKDPTAVPTQDNLHPEYKNQPAGPDFRVTVDK